MARMMQQNARGLVTGTSRARLREMYNELGDMGDVAQACRHTQVSSACCCFFLPPDFLILALNLDSHKPCTLFSLHLAEDLDWRGRVFAVAFFLSLHSA